MDQWVTVHKTRDIYIRRERVPLAEFYWQISGAVHKGIRV